MRLGSVLVSADTSLARRRFSLADVQSLHKGEMAADTFVSCVARGLGIGGVAQQVGTD